MGFVESTNIRQRPDEGYRRLFIDGPYWLWVWYDRKDGDVTGFELDRYHEVVIWKNLEGEDRFEHYNTFEAPTSYSYDVFSPRFDKVAKNIVEDFAARCAGSDIDEKLRLLILNKLRLREEQIE
jgi:hypothetical protein